MNRNTQTTKTKGLKQQPEPKITGSKYAKSTQGLCLMKENTFQTKQKAHNTTEVFKAPKSHTPQTLHT